MTLPESSAAKTKPRFPWLNKMKSTVHKVLAIHRRPSTNQAVAHTNKVTHTEVVSDFSPTHLPPLVSEVEITSYLTSLTTDELSALTRQARIRARGEAKSPLDCCEDTRFNDTQPSRAEPPHHTATSHRCRDVSPPPRCASSVDASHAPMQSGLVVADDASTAASSPHMTAPLRSSQTCVSSLGDANGTASSVPYTVEVEYTGDLMLAHAPSQLMYPPPLLPALSSRVPGAAVPTRRTSITTAMIASVADEEEEGVPGRIAMHRPDNRCVGHTERGGDMFGSDTCHGMKGCGGDVVADDDTQRAGYDAGVCDALPPPLPPSVVLIMNPDTDQSVNIRTSDMCAGGGGADDDDDNDEDDEDDVCATETCGAHRRRAALSVLCGTNSTCAAGHRSTCVSRRGEWNELHVRDATSYEGGYYASTCSPVAHVVYDGQVLGCVGDDGAERRDGSRCARDSHRTCTRCGSDADVVLCCSTSNPNKGDCNHCHTSSRSDCKSSSANSSNANMGDEDEEEEDDDDTMVNFASGGGSFEEFSRRMLCRQDKRLQLTRRRTERRRHDSSRRDVVSAPAAADVSRADPAMASDARVVESAAVGEVTNAAAATTTPTDSGFHGGTIESDRALRACVRDMLLANKVRALQTEQLRQRLQCEVRRNSDAAARAEMSVIQQLLILQTEAQALMRTFGLYEQRQRRARAEELIQFLRVPRHRLMCASLACRASFSVTTTRMTCRRCGDIFCPKCCQERGIGPDTLCDTSCGERKHVSLGWEPICKACWLVCANHQRRIVAERKRQRLCFYQDAAENEFNAALVEILSEDHRVRPGPSSTSALSTCGERGGCRLVERCAEEVDTDGSSFASISVHSQQQLQMVSTRSEPRGKGHIVAYSTDLLHKKLKDVVLGTGIDPEKRRLSDGLLPFYVKTDEKDETVDLVETVKYMSACALGLWRLHWQGLGDLTNKTYVNASVFARGQRYLT